MHILLTNDDGPPSNQSSPYVHSLVSTLQSAGHQISVVVPHTQRSWIGKAHLIGQTLTPSYFRPGTLHQDDGKVSATPFEDGEEEWVLIDGTPASCVQIGLGHLFQNRGPVDLVLSGPNYGRNTTTLFSLSSGTIGGAMEGAVCGKKAIALSYAFDSRVHDPPVIAAASDVSRRLIEKLVREWPEKSDIQLYSVNVPLRSGVATTKIMYTKMLQNTWASANAFEEVEVDIDVDDDPVQHERDIREAAMLNGAEISQAKKGQKQKKFKWSPALADVYDSVKKAGPGSDGWALTEGTISVTPLRASFWAVTDHDGQEIRLERSPLASDLDHPSRNTAVGAAAGAGGARSTQATSSPQPSLPIVIHLNYPDPSVQPLLIKAVTSLLPARSYNLITTSSSTTTTTKHIKQESPSPSPNPSQSQQQVEGLGPSSSTPQPHQSPFRFQCLDYEKLDFEHALAHPSTSLVCAYVIRKALIRKHYLANTIETWIVKTKTKTKTKAASIDHEKNQTTNGSGSASGSTRKNSSTSSNNDHEDEGEKGILERHFEPAVHFEVDYAEFLDEALVDAWDLHESMERNQSRDCELRKEGGGVGGGEREREWWILKPGMSDGGHGIRLFSSMEQLKDIFEEWEEEEGEEEEQEEEESGDDGGDVKDRVVTSQLRHFIAQPYIDPPLLLPSMGKRKFHIRVYVLAVGALKVYVYREMLALFAAKPYQSPSESRGAEGQETHTRIDMASHLTNTCFQKDGTVKEESVLRFWDLDGATKNNSRDQDDDDDDDDGPSLGSNWKEDSFRQICDVIGEVFEAAARGQMVHFQPLPNAFEIFGVDFLVDSSCNVWLLELNAYPDFQQTGRQLQDLVIGGLFRGVISTAVRPFFHMDARDDDNDNDNDVDGDGDGDGDGDNDGDGDGNGDDDDDAATGTDPGQDQDNMVLVGEIDLGRR